MDTETRLTQIEARVEKLEKLAETSLQRAQDTLSKLRNHPMVGAVIRMLED